MFYLVFAVADSLVEKGLKIWKLSLSPFQQIAPINRPWSIGCIALSFLVRQLLTFTAFYRPSTIKYQPFPLHTDPKYKPVPTHTDPVPPSTNQYHLLLSIKTSLFFFSSVKNIFPFSWYYPPFPSPFIVRSAKNIFFLHIFSSFFFLVDLRWAQLYVSLVQV